MLGYSSYWGSWGITYWLTQIPWKPLHTGSFMGLTPAQELVMGALKLVIIGSALAIAWRRRAVGGLGVFSTLALIWAVFFVFAPGVGGQYLVWIGPFLLLFSAGAFAAFTAAASLALFIFYNVISHGMPWDVAISTNALAPQWQPWMTLPWLTLVGVLILSWRELFRQSVAREQQTVPSAAP